MKVGNEGKIKSHPSDKKYPILSESKKINRLMQL